MNNVVSQVEGEYNENTKTGKWASLDMQKLCMVHHNTVTLPFFEILIDDACSLSIKFSHCFAKFQ